MKIHNVLMFRTGFEYFWSHSGIMIRLSGKIISYEAATDILGSTGGMFESITSNRMGAANAIEAYDESSKSEDVKEPSDSEQDDKIVKKAG